MNGRKIHDIGFGNWFGVLSLLKDIFSNGGLQVFVREDGSLCIGGLGKQAKSAREHQDQGAYARESYGLHNHVLLRWEFEKEAEMLSKEFHPFLSGRCLEGAPKITLLAIKAACTFADDTDVAVEGGSLAFVRNERW